MTLLLAVAGAVLVALFSATGQLLYKKASLLPVRHHWQRWLSRPFLAGSLMFAICPFISYFILSVLDYSLFYALTALTYIFVSVLSCRYLSERMDIWKLAGLACILAGLVLVGWQTAS
jgi:drug/metabolite transporter (DMT)-like permease